MFVETSFGAMLVLLTLGFVPGVILGMQKRRFQVRELERACAYDPLTGLRQSHTFEQEVMKQLQKVAPKEEGERADSSKHMTVFAFLDIDGFKRANDLLGHEAGDEILRILAKIISMHLRHEDLAFRRSSGADEFMLAFFGGTKTSAEARLLEIREEFENAISWAFPEVLHGCVSFSFGVAEVGKKFGPCGLKKAIRVAEERAMEDKKIRKMER